MIKGLFKKPGEEVYLSFKNKFIHLIQKAREDKVRWLTESELDKWEKEPTLPLPNRVSPALAWECRFPFPNGYPISTKFVFSNELGLSELQLAFDKIRPTLLQMEQFTKWYMAQLRCKMDNPKWVLGESYPGDSKIFLAPAKNILDGIIGGSWAFNVKFQIWVRAWT